MSAILDPNVLFLTLLPLVTAAPIWVALKLIHHT